MSPLLRDARPEDYDAYAELFAELGVDDPVPSRDKYQRDLMPSSFVLEEDQVIAYAYVQTLGGVGYVRQVIVRPGYRRRGLGRALMGEAARRFREAGCLSWCLNVKPENTAAIALYRSLGFKQAYASAAMRMGWDIVERLPSIRGCTATAVAAAEIPELEEQLAIQRGLLAPLVPRADRVVLVLRDGKEVVGLAAFDPTFPGCFPFRAHLPAHARVLLETLAPHADPRFSDVQLVFEDSPHLVEAFTAAGANLVLSFVHLKGSIPSDSQMRP